MSVIILLLAVLSLFPSCSGEKNISSDVLPVAVSQEPPVFDVHVNSSQVARFVMVGNVFEKVVTLDAGGQAVPELCESFHSLDDNHTWVFNLRRGVMFHNGKEMTSEDVVLSLNRWLEYNSNASALTGGARFYAVDEYTVRIDAASSILFLPEMMAASPQSAAVYSKDMFASLDADGLITEYIGTGPYTVEEWRKGEYIKLSRFDSYCPYGGEMDGLAGYKHAYIDTLIYYFVPDAFARTTGCETGQYLFINDLMNDDIPRLSQNENLVVSRGSEAGSFVLLFNKKEGPASQQYIRTAVNTALDLDVIMAACYGSGGYVMHPNLMESDQKLWVSDDPEPHYDIGDKEKAAAILEENGYDGTPVKVLSSNLSNMDKSALALESELEKAGFNVEVIIVDWAAMMEYRSDPSKWDICITAMTQVPLPSQKLYLSPDYAGWSDDEHLSSLMSLFNSASSIEEARSVWFEIQDYFYDYLPAIICGHYQSGYLYSNRLSSVNEYYGFYFWNTEIST